MSVSEIKKLAAKYTPEQIEGCIQDQVSSGHNVCLTGPAAEEIVGELAKAEFIRDLVDGGMELSDALRELARRIREVQKGGAK